jgi:hypothetical protein
MKKAKVSAEKVRMTISQAMFSDREQRLVNRLKGRVLIRRNGIGSLTPRRVMRILRKLMYLPSFI